MSDGCLFSLSEYLMPKLLPSSFASAHTVAKDRRSSTASAHEVQVPDM